MKAAFLTSQRSLTADERRHLRQRMTWLRRAAQASWLPTLLPAVAAAWLRELGWLFPGMLAIVPSWWAWRRLEGRRKVIEGDLGRGKVRCVMGVLGGSDTLEGWVALHLGGSTFWVRADLLRDKEQDQPITVELLGDTGIALTVDGRPNLPDWREGWRHDVPTL
ncbi:MAG: hypothetical protein FJY99_08670 [Candidatus Sericytochromatia bacterium]|nr:hypothetical protein [Candidatus Tanganyikabacteria bacterium]